MNIKQSLRIIFRNKTYSLLNIVGLAVGIVCAGLILLWVEDEVNFDKFPKSDNLYYVYQNVSNNGDINTASNSSMLLAPVLQTEIAGVKRVSRIFESTRYWGIDGKLLSGDGCFVDSTFFSMFDVHFISGNKTYAFDAIQSVVISESMALKFFGKVDPVGESLKMNNQYYRITGVYSDIQKNSSFNFEWMAPIDIQLKELSAMMNIHQWGVQHWSTIVELEAKANPAFVNELIYDLYLQKANYEYVKFFLYPLHRDYLYGVFSDGKETGEGYITTVRIFIIIALIILLIACINFINLATARSQKRALEVGMRKTFGGKRLNLLTQFTGESALITFFALVLAVIIIHITLPFFNNLVNKQLVLDLGKFTHWTGLLGVGLLSCLLAGIYPALYLSSFPPIDVLNRLKAKTGPELWFRKGLVVFQFAASLVLIICTSFIYLQVQHAKNRPLGMNIERVLTMETSDDIKKNYEPLKQTLLSTGVVSNVALSDAIMLQMYSGWENMNWPGKAENYDPRIIVAMVSADIISTMGLQLVDGKDFDSGMPEWNYMIINESMANLMGDEGHVGGRIRQGNSNYSEVIGIVKDFVFNNIYSIQTEPLIMWHVPSRTNRLFVQLNESDKQTALIKVGKVMNAFDSNCPFDYRFMSESYKAFFYNEQFISKLALLFAALAIFISCLGLFGLTAFSVEQRTREIGIRNVYGASVWSIILLLARNYVFQLFLSFIIAIPLAWFLVRNWLNDFDYRIHLSWFIFAASCLLVFLIAILTVSVLSFKAATANPIKAIKSE